MSTIKEQKEILDAYESGEEIEVQDNKGVWWIIYSKYPTKYEFDFNGHNYRIKSKPKKIPKAVTIKCDG